MTTENYKFQHFKAKASKEFALEEFHSSLFAWIAAEQDSAAEHLRNLDRPIAGVHPFGQPTIETQFMHYGNVRVDLLLEFVVEYLEVTK